MDFAQKVLEKNASESLRVAQELFEQKLSPLWVVVCSYYAMFYSASAFVYKQGYKAQHKIVHAVINEALIALGHHLLEKHFLEQYEEEKISALLLSENILLDYSRERVKRAKFQYQTTEKIKWVKAETSLNRAKRFETIIREITE